MSVFITLIIIGFISNYVGKLFEKIKLPSLIGMMIFGMIVGPSFLDIISDDVLNISPTIKDISLVTVLFIGGLGISLEQMKKIGKPAVLLSVVPATLEGFAIAILSMIFLDFTFVQGAILGFIIAAVSPAVLIPSMVSLIDKKIGQDKAIPQLLLVGASADDTVAITLFTTFLGIYMSEGEVSFLSSIISIPITILFSIGVSILIFKLTKTIILKVKNNFLKVFIAFFTILSMRFIEKNLHISIFNSLFSVMVYGFLIRNYLVDSSKFILDKMNYIWKYVKLYLFTFVGMAIDPKLVGKYFFIGLIILIISLSVRSLGVLISLRNTNLNNKEKLFCIIAYLPKATVQSAKSSVPLQMGVAGGEIMQAIAIFSVLLTAPIGSILIKLTSKRLLKTED